jgi:diacylglycerol kinase (ATP)
MVAGLLASFRHALRGIAVSLRYQRNLRIHAVATIAVLGLGLATGLPDWKWVALWMAIGLVWSAELVNTAIEGLCDLVQPERDERVRRIKDAAAGAVLVAALAAAVVGVAVFL